MLAAPILPRFRPKKGLFSMKEEEERPFRRDGRSGEDRSNLQRAKRQNSSWRFPSALASYGGLIYKQVSGGQRQGSKARGGGVADGILPPCTRPANPTPRRGRWLPVRGRAPTDSCPDDGAVGSGNQGIDHINRTRRDDRRGLLPPGNRQQLCGTWTAAIPRQGLVTDGGPQGVQIACGLAQGDHQHPDTAS